MKAVQSVFPEWQFSQSLMVLACFSIVGCSTFVSPNDTPSATSPTSPTSPTVSPQAQSSPLPQGSPKPQSPKNSLATPTPVSQPLNASPKPTASPQKTTTVIIYTLDQQCNALVPKRVSVPVQQPMQAAVGKVLEQDDNADFSFSGYRVSVDPRSGTATIDLRPAPSAKRKITSLSSCEQLALFGSLRKTLISNAQWKVKTVRFTQQGREIVF